MEFEHHGEVFKTGEKLYHFVVKEKKVKVEDCQEITLIEPTYQKDTLIGFVENEGKIKAVFNVDFLDFFKRLVDTDMTSNSSLFYVDLVGVSHNEDYIKDALKNGIEELKSMYIKVVNDFYDGLDLTKP